MDGYHLKYSGEKVEEAIELALTEPDRINSEIQRIEKKIEESFNVDDKADVKTEDLRFYYGMEDIVPTDSSYFTYVDNGDGTCVITGASSAGVFARLTKVVLPYKINDLKVVEIRNDTVYPDGDVISAENTFIGATSIIIPSSVTKIGTGVFTGTSINDFYIPDSVTEIVGSPFCGCTIKSVRLSENLKILSNEIFDGAVTDIDKLYIPDSVETIKESKMGGCIMRHARYVSIPSHAMYSHAIPECATNIVCVIRGGTSFKELSAPCFGNSSDVRLILPNTCETLNLDHPIFYGNCIDCVVEIPSSVTSIEGTIFDGSCTNSTIVCEQGSYAETWAKENGINVKYNVVNSVTVNTDEINKLIGECSNAMKKSVVFDGPTGLIIEDVSPIFHQMKVTITYSDGVVVSDYSNLSIGIFEENLVSYTEYKFNESGEAYIPSNYSGVLAVIYSGTIISDSTYIITLEYNQDINRSLADKADRADTLAGYGITDAYTSIEVLNLLHGKQNKTQVSAHTESMIGYDLFAYEDTDYRCSEVVEYASIYIPDGSYSDTYISGLSFNSGDTPTQVDYTGTGILNWVGTDCSVSEGYSIFQPSPNTHYDIVFYYNGMQFVGLVNGFVPAIGNEVA